MPIRYSSVIAQFQRMARVTFLTLSFALVLGNAWAQRELTVRGPFLAKEAGITFPERVRDFQRVIVTIYSADAKNIGVGYNLLTPANPVAVTVYIYPARRVISIGSPRSVVEGARQKLEQMEMDSIIQEILNAHRGARVVLQETSSITTGRQAIRALHARFAYGEVFAGKKQELLGDVWLSTAGKWYVKYRVTYSAANERAAMSSVKKLMSALPVPVG
jgi:hypothetical protein